MLELKLVVVEDDEVLLKRITRILKREIAEVYSFSNPDEALEKILEINPDIIVSDIHMPGMSGLEMYKKIKDKNLDVPIIMASAFSEPKYFIEAIKLKVKNFIVKPIDIDNLLNEIRQFNKEIEEKKELSKKEKVLRIQSKMAAMGEMLGNIAHQWKQPLNTISLSASTIQVAKEMKTIDYEKDLDEYLDNIMNSVDYMNTTMSDFQNYLKPNKLESCFYLEDTMKKVENLIIAQCKAYDITLIKNIQNTHLCNYQNELLQVILNIIKNATDELIKIKTEKYIFIDITEEDGETVIKIKDNAGGIKQKNIDSIFEAYVSGKEETEGTGIGLYMSKQIVENSLEGKINVTNSNFIYNNKEYYGAEFTIRLNSLVGKLTDT
ncbi:MAG: response regulator [Arcobacter sp.]|uniref:response regulator n=1 Tax=Arcobacter sp. TaxID=1872629 RepID=UPI003B00B54E